MTFADSNWLMSIVLFRQPHFYGQPESTRFVWGYGLHADRPGNFLSKPMTACSGIEILRELAGHLGLDDGGQALFGGAQVIPCVMPFITSQFMPRRPGDRPKVIPDGAANFALIGQFCEMPDDVAFTVEYSVRSAMTAVYGLTGRGRGPPPVRLGTREPAVLLRAARALLRD
jgi:oleate hydratase